MAPYPCNAPLIVSRAPQCCKIYERKQVYYQDRSEERLSIIDCRKLHNEKVETLRNTGIYITRQQLGKEKDFSFILLLLRN